ncbi:hypothetical protein CXB51_025476 [Gossypium anomalum]|uniref:Transposase-associated domain-containing protein n=1 Tax=Gossypium anomalum TaxID=47600 RepID=A0A8J5YCV4_9ROSI|nr:hypothetical protein CXB51_025476 [Gossypium anomalum]
MQRWDFRRAAKADACHCSSAAKNGNYFDIARNPYVGEHLRLHGIIKEYKYWIFRGESIERTSVQTDQTVRTSPSICTQSQDNEADLRDLITDALGINIPTLNESFDGVSSEFQNNGREDDFNEAQRTTKRATTLLDDCDIPLYPAKSLTCLLEFLNEAFPDGNTIPTTYYEAKKNISALNLRYVKIDACPNDCMLYWGDASKKISCDVCKTSRWQSSNELDVDEQVDDSCRRPKPAKVLRYFPLIPRLKRLFQSSKTSQSMRWHKEGRTKDGILRHPADGSAWDAFDKRFLDFASDPRNVRLGLASDGFNPFRTTSTSYRIDAFDSSASESFTLRACLLWTINDFLAYASLSGWSTKGRVACPICAEKTESRWLRVWGSSIPRSGEDILREVEGVNFIYGKTRKRIEKN